jgi:hypothetical protein
LHLPKPVTQCLLNLCMLGFPGTHFVAGTLNKLFLRSLPQN